LLLPGKNASISYFIDADLFKAPETMLMTL